MQQIVQSFPAGVVAGSGLPQPSSRGVFVVNLGSSSTPVALSEPRHPELKPYTFFISRRREDGRERFRLHMGYFDSQQDAELMLDLVRDVYPGAWAGVAPGRKPSAPISLPPTEIVATPPVAPPEALAAVAAVAAVAGVAEVAAVAPVSAALVVTPPDEHHAATQSLDSVRAAIASLDDSARLPALSPTQTLKLLEEPPLDLAPTLAAAIPKFVPPPTPSPTLAPEAIAAYAVQLRWAAQPIGISELPPLAIFDAYTLYRAKGRQETSHWHALRLGFFNDLVSANQVASYIRPEFAEATVVPVGMAERDKALSVSAARTASGPTAAKARAAEVAAAAEVTGQFKLIDESGVRPVEHSKLEMMLTDAAEPGKANGTSRPKQKTRRPPANLEETLDILGAGSLKLADKKGELLDASGVRRMRHAAERKTPSRSSLSKLFDRLADRIGGGR